MEESGGVTTFYPHLLAVLLAVAPFSHLLGRFFHMRRLEISDLKKGGRGGIRPSPTSEAVFRMPILPLKLKKIESNFSI